MALQPGVGNPGDDMIQRRKYSRIDANIPFEMRPVPPEEAERAFARLAPEKGWAEFPMPGDMDDQRLNDWLHMLNRKMDAVLNLLSEKGDRFASLPVRPVNISGGGIRITAKEKFEKGDIVEIRMVIPLEKPASMAVYGEVLRVEEAKNHYNEHVGYAVAAQFVNMDENVRKKIVEFVFLREREILILKKG